MALGTDLCTDLGHHLQKQQQEYQISTKETYAYSIEAGVFSQLKAEASKW